MSIAVVIPTRNSARTLQACLSSALDQTRRADQLIVVDNHSDDGTPRIAADMGATVLTVGPERCAQRNAGWRAAGTEAVAFIDSDMVLEPDVIAQAVTALDQDAELGSLVIPELAFGEGFLARCRAVEKQLYVGNDHVEAARVFRSTALEQVGGYDERLVACEDWDLADRTRAAGWRQGRIAAHVHHDEGRVTLMSAFAKKRYYGATAAPYLKQRARPVTRRGLLSTAAFRAQPMEYGGMLVLKGVDAAGMAVGLASRWVRR